MKGYFGESHVLFFGGIFALRWLSYSVAGRGFVKSRIVHPSVPPPEALDSRIAGHVEGGATKGGVSNCEQTQTNADKRRGKTQRRKRKQTRANVDKCKQTLTPLYCNFFTPPLCNPLIESQAWNRRNFRNEKQ